MPQPATDAKLGEQVARLVRDHWIARAAWELYLIHGLPQGKSALLTKIHHAAVDGMSGAEILSVLLDTSPEGRPAPPPETGRADVEPTELEMLARGVIAWPRYFGRVVRAAPRVLPDLEDSPFLAQLPGQQPSGARPSASREPRAVAHRASWSEARSRRRRRASMPTSHRTGVSPSAGSRSAGRGGEERVRLHAQRCHHVVCAGALGRSSSTTTSSPTDRSSQGPGSVRTEAQRGTYGNRVGVMSPPLHTDEPDPVQRLALTHQAMRSAKELHEAVPASLMQDSSEFIPPAVFARATRVSNVAGSSSQADLERLDLQRPRATGPAVLRRRSRRTLFPVSIITDGMGLNITVFSYCGHLDFGIVADRELMPDVWNLLDYLGESLSEHLAALG